MIPEIDQNTVASRADFVAKSKPEIKELAINLNGKPVMIRAMSPDHNDYIKNKMMQTVKYTKDPVTGKEKGSLPSIEGLTVPVLLRSLCGTDGTLIFDPASKADAAILNGIPYKELKAIFDEAWEWSGCTDEAVDELEKNSEQTV